MVEFYLKLTRNRIANGMDREEALAKVQEKWREAVEERLDDE